jgi:IS605 OrfB family transposase
VSQWRKATRNRAAVYGKKQTGRDYMGGKSSWAIEYLTNVRKALQAWSLHGRRSGEIRRADRSRQGTFAAKLLNHINSLKDDRIKAGSDLIVQAARGFVRGVGGRWERRFEPVRFIFMEDLARYRFKVDRPRRENSQLMRWAHREIRKQVEMQAEIYGITVGDTGAGFTSRFYARDHTPGCRSQVLTKEDMQSPLFLQRLIDEGIASTIEAFKPGMRIVRDGGPDFVTLDRDRKPIVIQADINAAQNLQRRFWTRHSDPYRLTAIKVNVQGNDAYYCDSTGKRLTGAFKKVYGSEYICLVPAEDGNGFEVQPLRKSQWQQVVGKKATDDEESPSEDELGAAFQDDFVEVQREGGREVFFRDPSGKLLRSDRWYLSKEYWGRVKSQIVACLKRE